MSRRLHRAPFALASDGTVLVNVAEFDGVTNLDDALRRARTEGGAVFVGVPAKPDEMADAVRRLSDGFAEAAAYLIGGRQARRLPRGTTGGSGNPCPNRRATRTASALLAPT